MRPKYPNLGVHSLIWTIKSILSLNKFGEVCTVNSPFEVHSTYLPVKGSQQTTVKTPVLFHLISSYKYHRLVDAVMYLFRNEGLVAPPAGSAWSTPSTSAVGPLWRFAQLKRATLFKVMLPSGKGPHPETD